jgi:hypothetical protein
MALSTRTSNSRAAGAITLSSSSPSSWLATSPISQKSFVGTTQPHQQHQPADPPRDFIHLASTFTAGVGSAFMASIICAPLDLVRTRMQVWGVVVGGKSQSVVHVIKDIVRTDGFKGLFRGLSATLVTVPLFWGVVSSVLL